MLLGNLSKNDTVRMQGAGQLNEKVHSDANPFQGRTALKANLATAVFHLQLRKDKLHCETIKLVRHKAGEK